MNKTSVPVQSHAIAGSSPPDKRYYDWFLRVDRALQSIGINASSQISALARKLGSPDGTIESIPDASTPTKLVSGDGVNVTVNDQSHIAVFALDEVPDAGGGTLQKTDVDGYGRVVGTSAATTDDLPEGSNLYFTDARAIAAVGGAGGGGEILVADGISPPVMLTNEAETDFLYQG